MGSDREQDLAQTATAAVTAVRSSNPVGPTLGRYRLERELGAGAMGVVHAAFDPDLERRIALKVLRDASATAEARDRLLREARAMARLTHPNVVTVYEVGTAGGRDFVAMELIQGETLAEWLRATRRPPAEVLDAFAAAGRGLAAAHAAGIVHRDFKPHNVLRSRDGRIVVTDFGLAREATAALPPALDVTLPIGTATATATATASGTPSSLTGLTHTGSLLGTPAYMAPEQWCGGAVTPATDQFAYCVALWEALAGERPYPGPTLDDLRTQVARGPAALDISRVPRRVRGLLRRGLDPDPARRWPNMEALLARLVRAQRRPGLALAIIAGAVAAAVAAAVALRTGDDSAVYACAPPRYDTAAVWSPAAIADMRARTSDAHVAALDTAAWAWRAARGAACGVAPPLREAQLGCLDGAFGRFDALRQAFARAPGVPAEELAAQLVDPAVCRQPDVAKIPHLSLAPTPSVVAAYALYARSQTEHGPPDTEIAALIAAPDTDPCARAIATMAFQASSKDVARARALMSDAVADDRCGDERLRSDLIGRDIRNHIEFPVAGPKGEAALRRAQTAAARVMQPDVAADLALRSFVFPYQRGRWDEVFRLIDSAIAGYHARGLPERMLRALVNRDMRRLQRAELGDLEMVVRDAAQWRPIAVANHLTAQVHDFDVVDASARYGLGNVTAAHADLIRLWQTQPAQEVLRPVHKVTGEVVDAAGHPVAGARIAAAGDLSADAIGIGLPSTLGGGTLRDDDLRTAISDSAGRFTIDDAVREGAIAAELGDRRSRPAAIADRVRLVLEPTRTVSGRVELGQTAYTRVVVRGAVVGDPTGRYEMLSPVAPDGSFVIARAPTGAIKLGAGIHHIGDFDAHVEYVRVPASPAPVVGVTLELSLSSREIDVVIRSAIEMPLEGAQVLLLPGKQSPKNVGDIIRGQADGIQVRLARPIVGEGAPRAVLDKIRPGDLIAHVEHARLGDLTVCALGLNGDLHDPAFVQRLQSHVSQLAIRCEQIGPTTSVVELDVPPQQRFDDREPPAPPPRPAAPR